jgi:hypothetical protein
VLRRILRRSALNTLIGRICSGFATGDRGCATWTCRPVGVLRSCVRSTCQDSQAGAGSSHPQVDDAGKELAGSRTPNPLIKTVASAGAPRRAALSPRGSGLAPPPGQLAGFEVGLAAGRPRLPASDRSRHANVQDCRLRIGHAVGVLGAAVGSCGGVGRLGGTTAAQHRPEHLAAETRACADGAAVDKP